MTARTTRTADTAAGTEPNTLGAITLYQGDRGELQAVLLPKVVVYVAPKYVAAIWAIGRREPVLGSLLDDLVRAGVAQTADGQPTLTPLGEQILSGLAPIV